MDNDCLVAIYKMTFSNQNYLTRKFQKLMTSWDCHQTNIFQLTTDIKYYISINFKVL